MFETRRGQQPQGSGIGLGRTKGAGARGWSARNRHACWLSEGQAGVVFGIKFLHWHLPGLAPCCQLQLTMIPSFSGGPRAET